MIKIKCLNCENIIEKFKCKSKKFCCFECSCEYRKKHHTSYKTELKPKEKVYCKCGCEQEIINPRVYRSSRTKKIMIQKFIYGHTDSEKFTKLSKTLTKEILNKLYIEDKLSACQIAKEYKVFSATIISLLKKYKIETRTYLDSQKLYHSSDTYLKNNALHSIRMKENNPMFDEKHREKFYKTIKFGEENRSWKRKKIVCDCCGKSRYLKPSMYKKLVLNGICWNCYKHSRPKSSLEIKMKEELIRRNIEFKEQVPFKGLFLDFVLPNNIVIEVDGEYWHNLPENKARDQRKDKLLKQDGYKLFRFTDKQINTDIKLCVDKILK